MGNEIHEVSSYAIGDEVFASREDAEQHKALLDARDRATAYLQQKHGDNFVPQRQWTRELNAAVDVLLWAGGHQPVEAPVVRPESKEAS